MCAKEGIVKYDMWYGVVCKAVMSCTSAVVFLAEGRDTVPCLAITAICNTCQRGRFEVGSKHFCFLFLEARRKGIEVVHGAACWVLRGTHKLICCIGSARLLRFHVDAQVCDMKLVHLRD
jgi:hypothetical protein